MRATACWIGGFVMNSTTTSAPVAPQVHLSPNQRAWMRFKRNRPAVIGGIALILLVLITIIWPLFSSPAIAKILPKQLTYSQEAISNAQFERPSANHWFGTDIHGRDLLTRIFYGARISLIVGAVGAFVSLIIGVSWGAIAGYVGGRTDNIMMRFVDIMYALPSIIFVIVLKSTFEKQLAGWLSKTFSPQTANYASMLFLFIGLGAVSWLTMARIVRGQVLSLRGRNFVEASRTLGASHARILWKHILPNIYGIIIVYLTLTVPAIILYESFLSYLGLGIQPPQASWGSLIAEAVQEINPIRIYWWLLVFPGAMLVSTLLALNFLGDGLRDAFDPRGNK
ncbi:MAG: Binding-protein-dependent transport system inner rane component [Verrucomicrobiales bacterium]|nr:Binding-protein-dependent transport system inner rane component [Verrucomicrobiales bacterium]